MIEILIQLIRKYEGCKLTAYLCPAGIWTIGWGAIGPGIHKGVVWTQEQADARRKLDAERFAIEAAAVSPILWFNPVIHAAIADFCYNLGVTRYKASTLRRCVDRADWDGAMREIVKWVWGGGKKLRGLELRRGEEAGLIFGAK